MTISKNIFRDLEINVDNMMDDPAAFASEVYAAASKLTEVLNHDTSMRNARADVRADANKDRAAKTVANKQWDKEIQSITDWSETTDLHVLFHFIADLKELARDLELTFDQRATNEMIRNSPTPVDKRLAHEQYKTLRDAFETYRSFINLVVDDNIVLVPLKAKTGNFGGAAKRTYIAFTVGKDKTPMHNYKMVGRLLGIEDELNSPMDLVERLTEEMECQVVEVTL